MKVHGEGILDNGVYPAHFNGKQTKEYRLWCAMLRRCYSGYTHLEYPTYRNCVVSENFKSFQYFAEWCNNQIGFSNKNWCLDKDLLGNSKEYREDCCVFIPNILNTAHIKPYKNYFCNKRNKYEVRISKFSKSVYIGSFERKEDADSAYKQSKSKYIFDLITMYSKDLDARVNVALTKMYS